MISFRDPDVFDLFEEDYVPERLPQGSGSHRTPAEYRNTLQALQRTLGRVVAARELSDELVVEFRQRRLAAKISVPTCNKDLRHLRAVAKLGKKYGYGCQEIELEPLPEVDTSPQCYSVEEYDRILAACGERRGMLRDVPVRDFWRGLLEPYWDCGFRITAMMLLPESSIDFALGVVTAPACVQKDRADMLIEVSERAIEAMAKLRGPRPRRHFFADLWGYDRNRKRDSWRTLTKHFREILQAAGLPSDEKDPFHKIRRSTATYRYIEAGIVAAQAHMGHSKPEITWRYIDRRKAKCIVSARSMRRPKSSYAVAQQRDLF